MYKQLIYLLFGLVIIILGFGILIVSDNEPIGLALGLVLLGKSIVDIIE